MYPGSSATTTGGAEAEPVGGGDGVGTCTPQSDASTVTYYETPRRSVDPSINVATTSIVSEGSSTTSWESSYETDPDYSGPPAQS